VDVHNNTCTLCHISATDGRFANGTNYSGATSGGTLGNTVVGTAVGHPIGGQSYCINCHSGYDTDFDGSHQQETHSELSGVVGNCDTCHGTDIIGTIHSTGGCETCHTDVTPLGGENGTFVALSSAENHNGTSNCIECHTDFVGVDGFKTGHNYPIVDTHANVLRNVDSLTPSLDCDSCHTEAAANIHDVTHDKDNIGGDFACLRCHQSMNDNGRLINGSENGEPNWGDATGHTTIGQLSDCADCHGPYFQYHVYGGTHNGVSYDGGVDDTSMTAEIGCASNTCHQDYTTDTTSLDTWAGIKDEHNEPAGSLTNGCSRCHDYDGNNGGGNNTNAAATATAISDGYFGDGQGGSSETCATCHLLKVPNFDHGTHTDSQFAPESECSSCHGSTGVVGTIHIRCGLCHLNSAGAGTLIGSAVGQTLSNSTCQQCHTGLGTTALRASTHHTTDWAQKGNCEKCHDGASKLGPTVNSTPIRQLLCVTCHISNGSQFDVIKYDLDVLRPDTPIDPAVGTALGQGRRLDILLPIMVYPASTSMTSVPVLPAMVMIPMLQRLRSNRSTVIRATGPRDTCSQTAVTLSAVPWTAPLQ
jgi:hypothetical protein